jgi:hypothetical protein
VVDDCHGEDRVQAAVAEWKSQVITMENLEREKRLCHPRTATDSFNVP